VDHLICEAKQIAMKGKAIAEVGMLFLRGWTGFAKGASRGLPLAVPLPPLDLPDWAPKAFPFMSLRVNTGIDSKAALQHKKI